MDFGNSLKGAKWMPNSYLLLFRYKFFFEEQENYDSSFDAFKATVLYS